MPRVVPVLALSIFVLGTSKFMITVQRREHAGSTRGRDRDRGRFGYAAPSWIALILVGGSILLGLTACLRDRGDRVRA